MRSNVIRFGAVACGIILATACSTDKVGETTSITDPSSASFAKGPKADDDATKDASKGKRVEGLLWTSDAEKLVKGRSATGSFGSAGGTLSIPQAGVQLVIPQGALTSAVVITMKVHNGKTVSYDFSPHGLTFAKPLVLTQGLAGTQATAASALFLALGYYSDDTTADDTGASVDEMSAGWLDVAAWTFSSKIWHFSGYMLASGRNGAE